MKRSLAFCFLSLLVLFSCSKKSFKMMSKQLNNTYEYNPRWKGKTFHDLRMMNYKKGLLDFAMKGSDTLFILERHDIESDSYLSSIWKNEKSLNYIYNSGKFKYLDGNLFSNHIVECIQKWDTGKIRQEEERYSNGLHQYFITAIMIISQQNTQKVYCIKFKAFPSFNSDIQK